MLMTTTTTDVVAELIGSNGMKLTVRERRQNKSTSTADVSATSPKPGKAINHQTTRNCYRSFAIHYSKTNDSLRVQTRKQ
jgi:hypothetical protein